MAEFAAHFVDAVIPRVPTRQWVLSLPFELRFRLAYDHRLLTAVLRVVMRAILGFQRRRARERLGIDEGGCGSITVVQRFGGALNLNVHFHAVVLDGVHAEAPDGSVSFHALPAPSSREIDELTALLAERLNRLLHRRGLLDEDEPEQEWSESLVTHCQAASLRGRIAVGARAGRQVQRIVSPVAELALMTPRRGVAGLDLHVGPRIRTGDRGRLEKLCRYVMRPPLAQGRLKALRGNRYRYEFRRPWRDGTVAIELSGQELVEKLVALIPAPRANLVRYHGTLAPNARLRASIVPRVSEKAGGRSKCGGVEEKAPPERSLKGYSWADLMRRVFEKDVLECARCKGRLALIATITEPSVVQRILDCIGLPARPPPLAPARGPWQEDLDFEGP